MNHSLPVIDVSVSPCLLQKQMDHRRHTYIGMYRPLTVPIYRVGGGRVSRGRLHAGALKDPGEGLELCAVFHAGQIRRLKGRCWRTKSLPWKPGDDIRGRCEDWSSSEGNRSSFPFFPFLQHYILPGVRSKSRTVLSHFNLDVIYSN